MVRNLYNIALLALIMPISLAATHNVITIFSPGFSEKKPAGMQQAARYCRNNIIQKPYLACCYNDSYLKANFGQKEDINALFEQCRSCSGEGVRIILAGISRGASTLFTLMNTKELPHIAAVVAESPYATFTDVIAQKIGKELGYLQAARMALGYPAYNVTGPHPIDVAYNEALISVPMLLVCSEKDPVVPHTSTVRLAHKLKRHGYQHVYLVIFPEGEHGFLSYKEEFQEIVNAFYMRYNLPFNPTLAKKGIAKLDHYKVEL